ncbi:MAG: hypothetical protein PGN24_02790 [Microbacterium arborescens]
MPAVTLGAVIAVMVAGCASNPAGAPVPSASGADSYADAVSAPPGAVSGSGPTEFPGGDFPIPADARSVVIDFSCEGDGMFSLELGDSMMLGQAPLGGTCGEPAALSWPITERTGPTLYVGIADGVDWVATPTFSTEEFATDAAVAADCTAFIDVYSALANADTGYSSYGAFGEDEWNDRVDRAAAALETLAATSQSALADSFTGLHQVVVDPARTVGAVLSPVADEWIAPIHRACNANQTPLVIRAEFGG